MAPAPAPYRQARPLLSAALETFQRLGARPWVERAQAELRAAGIEATDVVPSAFTELSPQQQQIVQLAARGLTNREIGEKLFLSPRTVGSHLYRVFPKLGITARSTTPRRTRRHPVGYRRPELTAESAADDASLAAGAVDR